MSHLVQAELCTMITCFGGARLSAEKAPAAAINKKQDVRTVIVIIYDNIHVEKGACGRYNRKHKSKTYLVHSLINQSIDSLMYE